MPIRRRLTVGFAVLMLAAGLPFAVLAQATSSATTTPAKPLLGETSADFPRMKLNVPIPGLELASNIKVIDGFITVPYLAQYVSAVYKYLIGVSVVAASIMFVYGGFLYVARSAGDDIKDAKQKMVDAVIGLVLLFSIQLTIDVLSPETFGLKPLQVAYITPKESKWFQVVGATSPYTDGAAGLGGDAPSTNLGEPDPNYTPPAGCPVAAPASAANSYGRMMAACPGKDGSPGAMLEVLKAWKKAGIDEHGSVYAWGGLNGGKKLVVAAGSTDGHALHMYLSAIADTTFLTPAVREKCELEGSPPNVGEGHTAKLVKEGKNAECGGVAGPAFNKYMDAVRCNNIFGGDCVTTADALLQCAGVLGKGRAKSPLGSVRNMAAQAIQKGEVTFSKLQAAGGILEASNGVFFAKTKADMIRAKETGQLKFGATIGVRCAGHIITYTGGAPGEWGYDIFQTGNGGGAPPGPKAALSFKGNGKPNDPHNYAMSLVADLSVYVQHAATNCPDKEPKTPAEWYWYNQF